jgi:hypothetical protein
MKINKFNKLKEEFEIFSFEKNFNPLSTTLYYFSFLGNIFLILFSYFFIKDVTNSIPSLFKGQDLFFSIFIILFMTGYELFKRFAFEQLIISFIKAGKATLNNILALGLCLGLVVGSFYLSLNGSHRLIDTSSIVITKLDSVTDTKADSIAKYYDKEIAYYRSQSARVRSERIYRDSIVNVLQITKDAKIKETEQKVGTKLQSQTSKIKDNSTAFAIMVFFLEFIILLGVSFSSFYRYTSYTEMKALLTTPKFKQITQHLQLLKLYYQNGRKKEGDPVVAKNKFTSLVSASKLGCTQREISDFINICSELEIIVGDGHKKIYNMGYDKAYEIIENKD